MSELDSANRVAAIGSAYRSRAWLAMILLLAFLALYLLLASWFTWTAYRMLSGLLGGGGGAVAGFFSAIPALFLAVFMWKALFFVRAGASSDNRIEITAQQQPRLFDFIYQLADELGAPKPHKIFVSPVVNASVFYDLSIINLLLPSKKNMMFGLGLVNSLDRSEFRAVLAHEFGHFAQKTMSVGRWVYIGSQIAEHIVSKRDWLDSALDWLSRFDLRLAWIGWIMRTVVWSIRSLTETVFGLVLMAQRALSREMEFEADLVAVSATGSDALIHALHKLQVADEDWSQALNFADQMLWQRKLIPDPFLIQLAITAHLRNVLHQPDRGETPAIPVSNASDHRIFSEKLAQPPKMWATHPPNNERESNAKRTYIVATLDPTPAWSLFDNVESLKASVTNTMIADFSNGNKQEIKQLTAQESLDELEEIYTRNHFDPTYQGAYRARLLMTAVEKPEDAYGELPQRDQITNELNSLYPDSLRLKLEQWRSLCEDVVLLESIENGTMDAPSGVVRHRGRDYELSAISSLIEQVRESRDQARASIEIEDRKCRAAHHTAARYIGRGWQDYHGSLVKLLHYSEHSMAELIDAKGYATNLFHMSIAAGRPSEKRIRKIMDAMNQLHRVMSDVHSHKEGLTVPPSILEKLEVASWKDALSDFKLPPANRENLSEWLNVLESWYAELPDRYQTLRDETLDELLAAEAQISEYYLSGEEAAIAPNLVAAPETYTTRVRGTERELQKRLDWWSRFTLADGKGPAIVRLGVAASIVGGVILLGTLAGSAKLMICNGLTVPVRVRLEKSEVTVGPQQTKSLSPGNIRGGTIRTTTKTGQLIEEFEADLSLAYATYVYNVAGATSMTEWEVAYGNARPSPPKDLGAIRWMTTNAFHIFEQPPKQVKIEGDGATRSVLTHHAKKHPREMLSYITDEAERTQAVKVHAMWDAGDSLWMDQWLGMAANENKLGEILDHRLANDPDDFIASLFRLETFEQDDEKEAYKKQIRQRALSKPSDANLQYLSAYTEKSGPSRDQKYLEGAAKFPNNYLFKYACAMVSARAGNFKNAEEQLSQVVRSRGPWRGEASKSCARLRRLLAEEDEPDYRGLKESFELLLLLMIEEADPKKDTSPHLAFKLLADGKSEAAYKRAKGSEMESRIICLLAASQDSSQQWQKLALALPLDELRQHEKLYLAGLCARLGEPYDKLLDSYRENEPTARRSAADVLTNIIKNGPDAISDELLVGLNPDDRGYVLAAATTFAPDAVLSKWKLEAKRLLFSVERPWFEAEE